MTIDYIVKYENRLLEEDKTVSAVSFDEHERHIFEHCVVHTRESLEHIKEHLFFLALDENLFSGTYLEFERMFNNYIKLEAMD